MSNLIERLHNCPNCGGTLQDDGICRFCGSKVYDFVGIDLDNYSLTYVRTKWCGNIIVMPVRFTRFCIETSMDAFPTGYLEFIALQDMIIEDTKITGSEY